MRLVVIAILIILYGLTGALIPPTVRRFRSAEIVKKNYRNRCLPCGVGIVFGLLSALGAGYVGLVLNPGVGIEGSVFVAASLFVLLVGFLDDLLGRDDYKGFSGHLRALLAGTLTMGMVKALGALSVVAWAMYFMVGPHPFALIREVLVVLLMVNLINLFDLRPGRAGKVFYGFFALLAIFHTEPGHLYLFLPLLVSFSAYFRHDLSARVMMGDAGASFLGLNLGFMSVMTGGPGLRTALLALLVVLHLAAERVSFSEIIERNGLLSRLDGLGVKE